MSDSKIYPLWRNDAGVTLTASLNQWPEQAGSARCSLVPEGTYQLPSGVPSWNVVTGETSTIVGTNGGADWTYGNTTYRVGTDIRGYPTLRKEHVFEVPVEGYDKMFLQWRGEVVSATGFANTAGFPNTTRNWWGSREFVWAHGSLYEDTDVTFMRDPRVVTYNSNEYGKMHSVMAGAATTTNLQPVECVGGMPLAAQGFSVTPGKTDDYKQFVRRFSHNRLAWDQSNTSTNCLSTCGLLWGYTEKIGGVASSRFPQAGDKLDAIFEIGYPDTFSPFAPESPYFVNRAEMPTGPLYTAPNTTMRLSISGLSKVYCNIQFLAPGEGDGNGLENSNSHAYLEFDNVVYTVRGRLVAKLVRTSGYSG